MDIAEGAERDKHYAFAAIHPSSPSAVCLSLFTMAQIMWGHSALPPDAWLETLRPLIFKQIVSRGMGRSESSHLRPAQS